MKIYLLLLAVVPCFAHAMEQSTDLSPEIEALFEAAENNVELPDEASETGDAERKQKADLFLQKKESNAVNPAQVQDRTESGSAILVACALRAHIRLGNCAKVRALILNGAMLSSDDLERTLRFLNARKPIAVKKMIETIAKAQDDFKLAQSAGRLP